MEILAGRTSGTNYDFATQSQNKVQNTELVKQENQAQATEQKKVKETENSRDLDKATEEMTKWIQSLNTDIRFALHEETKSLMVQVIDIKDQRVLKEFPPHDFLDMVAKIREYVGMLLDEKA